MSMLDGFLCLLGVAVVVVCCWGSDRLLRARLKEGERD